MPERGGLGRFLVYAAVGAAGTAGHYAFLLTAVSLGVLAPVPASVIGALVGAVINFVLNAVVTFRGHAHSHLAWGTAARFFATAGVAAALNGAAMAVLVNGVRLDYRLAQVLVTGTLLCATYVVNSLWTFQASKAR
ncbi:Putative flippase GtrA (transmembrane translocase of bactoprenol-linked glucose) [Massilia sp. PDC64]|nr:GtrA family protein [Massilia sp. PDC64]SDC11786.1 Putative flippase GtrA (transmembrane translocase of bactoprenol-linked glucose) [Massilia sp. PDC64]